MISGIGVDIEETKRFKNVTKEFLNLLFTEREIAQCKMRKASHICFAGKFCAKEAVIKAYDKGVGIKDIEIINAKSGKPIVYIKGRKINLHCSISHTKSMAISYAIMES